MVFALDADTLKRMINMDMDFYEALGSYEDGNIDREQFLAQYPDDESWLDEIDAEQDEE